MKVALDILYIALGGLVVFQTLVAAGLLSEIRSLRRAVNERGISGEGLPREDDCAAFLSMTGNPSHV